jgi:hypothetical protein
MRIACLALLIPLAFAAGCGPEPIDGHYVADEQPSLSLDLSEGADGAVTGTLTGPTGSAPLVGRRQEDLVAGTLGSREGNDATAFSARLEEDRLTLLIGSAGEGQTVPFHRAAAASKPATP